MRYDIVLDFQAAIINVDLHTHHDYDIFEFYDVRTVAINAYCVINAVLY